MQLFDFQHLHIVAALGLILPILELKRSTLNMMASTLVTLIMEPDLVLSARHHHHHTVFFNYSTYSILRTEIKITCYQTRSFFTSTSSWEKVNLVDCNSKTLYLWLKTLYLSTIPMTTLYFTAFIATVIHTRLKIMILGQLKIGEHKAKCRALVLIWLVFAVDQGCTNCEASSQPAWSRIISSYSVF